MNFLSLDDLNLSPNATAFVTDHIGLLDKPLTIIQLPDDYPNFACTSPHPDLYPIGIRTNFDKADFDATFCHELYHACQFSLGFPTAQGYSPDTSKYCENLRSTILDLSANEMLKKYNLTYKNIVKTRYAQCQHLCATSFKEIDNPFNEALLAVDLILDLSDFTNSQCNSILYSLKKCLPNVYKRYTDLHKIIFENYDYHTKEGCLKILGHIITIMNLWNVCSINYCGTEIRTLQRFNRVIRSISSD